MTHNFSKKLTKVAKPWLKKHFILVLILSAVVAVAISLIIGLMQSVWFDEAYSITLAKNSFSGIINLTAVDVHPPFYYFLLHSWGGIFGWSEIALRSLSAVAMGGAVVFAGILVKKLFGYRAAYFTLPFIVFSPLLLRYGFEIRMYAVAALIGIAATYVLVSARLTNNIKRSKILYVIYALLVALGMFTLYYMALLWLAHFVWLAYQTYKDKEKLLKSKWLWAYGLSIILFSPWLIVFVKQITNGALAAISQSMTLENLFGIVSFNFLYRPVWQLGALYSLIIMFVVVMISYLSIKAFQLIDKKQKKYLSLLVCYILVPVAILTLIGLVKPMYTERYLAHISIGGLMYVGVITAIVTRKASWKIKWLSSLLVMSMMIGVLQLFSVGNYNFQRLQKPEVKEVAAVVKKCGDGVAILAADPYVATELGYYLSSCKINFYSEYASLGGGYAPLSNSGLRIVDPKIELFSSKEIYYIYYGDAKLNMPANFISVSSQTNGNLTVEKFIAN